MVKLTGLSVRDIRFPTSLELHGSDAMVRTLQKPLNKSSQNFRATHVVVFCMPTKWTYSPSNYFPYLPRPGPTSQLFGWPDPAKGGISEEGDREIKTEVIA